MKKEILAGEHCPHCKRHCSLINPHCGKGKALAEKKIKEEKKLKEEKTLKEEKKFKEEKKLKEEKKIEEEKLKEDRQKDELLPGEPHPTEELAPVLNKEEWKNIQSEIRLLCLCHNGGNLLSGRKAGKQGGKEARFSILAVLAEKGDLTQKELKENSGLHSGELEEALEKLEKKGHVSRKQAEDKNIKISLTSKGFKSAKEHIRNWKRENDGVLSPLTDEEKKSLEGILKKILK